jgi:hypothetical protein
LTSSSSKKPDTSANTTSTPDATPAGIVAEFHGPAQIDLSAVKGMKIKPEQCKWQREGGLCIYCGDSRHFVASCPKKLKAASGQIEINQFQEDLCEGKDKEEESGKV